jgi:hypothetical protein
MPSHSPATLPRFSMAIEPETRETLEILKRVRDQSASGVVRSLLKEAARRHSAEIEAYLALRVSARHDSEAA